MAISDIDLGSSPNDGTGSTLRAGGAIVNLILDMWNTVTGGIAYLGGKVGIGTATPIGLLHLVDSPVTAAGTSANDITTFEHDTAANINLVTGTSSLSALFFSDTTRAVGMVRYDHADDRLIFISADNFSIQTLPVYANNAAALVGLLEAGDLYKTASTGDAIVMVVNAT